MNRRCLLVLSALIIGLVAHPTLGQQLNCHNQKECDFEFLSRKLVEAALPANPADIIGKAFCAGTGGGSIWCGTVVGMEFSASSNVLYVYIDRRSQRAYFDAIFDFTTKTWRGDGLIDWISIDGK